MQPPRHNPRRLHFNSLESGLSKLAPIVGITQRAGDTPDPKLHVAAGKIALLYGRNIDVACGNCAEVGRQGRRGAPNHEWGERSDGIRDEGQSDNDAEKRAASEVDVTAAVDYMIGAAK